TYRTVPYRSGLVLDGRIAGGAREPLEERAFAAWYSGGTSWDLSTLGPRQGDVTGDGVADLVAGGIDGDLAYHTHVENFEVLRVWAGGGGLAGELHVDAAVFSVIGSSTDRHDRVLSHADLDGDGVAEIALGAHYGPYMTSYPYEPRVAP